MVTSYFDEYCYKFPGIVIEILEYFDSTNKSFGQPRDKSVLQFCSMHMNGGVYIYQPNIVDRICNKLCEKTILQCLNNSDPFGMKNNYLLLLRDKKLFTQDRSRFSFYLNCTVYGFEYIYEIYKKIVVPLVWEKDDGDYSAGTGFMFLDGIVTAKHCITDANNLQIRGFNAEDLNGKSIYISDNEGIDLAFIHTGKDNSSPIYTDEGKIMQEVLVMGYPKIPAFTDFLTAERATISSKASSRITPTKGFIASSGFQYLSKMEALLITARIRGGNSGGPVINQDGCLVGIACQLPDTSCNSGDYDDLGYGVAVPVSYLSELIIKKSKTLDVPSDFFRDFSE
ncbi:S1 family peptidase [Succinivibrio dextrinosolvens]|uniref:S1 family peptidase n=1 Tax=Succinivibrio dextrinosolvens TaxID=83771 RepID=UPI0019229033|nr:serine protease [Succinivibrio dextrinosolvens]